MIFFSFNLDILAFLKVNNLNTPSFIILSWWLLKKFCRFEFSNFETRRNNIKTNLDISRNFSSGPIAHNRNLSQRFNCRWRKWRFLRTRFGDLLKNRSKLDQNKRAERLTFARSLRKNSVKSHGCNTGFQSDSSIAYATAAKWKRAQQRWKQRKFFQHAVKNISRKSGREWLLWRVLDSLQETLSLSLSCPPNGWKIYRLLWEHEKCRDRPSSFATKAAKVVDIRNIMTPEVLQKLRKFSKNAWFYFLHRRQIVKSLIS